MTKGPNRLRLDTYLDSATEGVVTNAGRDWKRKAGDLRTLAQAFERAAGQAELRIGEQTLTGPALRAGMEQSAASMTTKADQLQAAGEALHQVGQQLSDARDSRDALADLGAKPAPYQAPPGTGVEPTPEEIQAQADASQARANERSAWQSQYDKQEAKSLALTKELDAAFLGAIPPMKEIHGQEDPTEPPPNVPSGPQGPYLPGTQAPPVTGGGGNGGDGKDHGANAYFVGEWNGGNQGTETNWTIKNPPTTTNPTTTNPTTTTPTTTTPITTTPVHTEHPTTTVTGTSQSGTTYQPTGSQVSAPISSGSAGGSGGATSAAAFGAAGGAGGLAAGATRPGAMPTSPTRGASAVKPIGSTGRAGSAGSISRAPGSTGSAASRSTGSAPARGASAGSAAGRGSAGGRAGTSGARGASTGSGSGSRSGSRGSSGARAGGQGAGGRGGRKGEREEAAERDSLVYDQDWLGDDDVAPGVLD